MTFEEYEKGGRLLYRRVAETVAAILAAAITAHGSLRLQQIQSRAKEPGSLRKKLLKLGLIDTLSLGAAVKDLAGCRAVFYTNTDVQKYLTSGILSENFDIDWERSKIHHPVPSKGREDGTVGCFQKRDRCHSVSGDIGVGCKRQQPCRLLRFSGKAQQSPALDARRSCSR